jgi:plasmid maintenance system antidote protein VapI
MTADELRLTLMRLDWTQEFTAKLLGRSPRAVRHWIAGDRPIAPEVYLR